MDAIRDWFRRHLGNPQIVSLLLVLLAGWAALTWFGQILAPLFVAVVLTYVLEGSVSVLERRLHFPRWFASTSVWLVFVTLGVVSLMVVVPLVSRQATQVIQELPAIIGNIQAFLITLPEKYPSLFTPQQVDELMFGAGEYVSNLRKGLLSSSFGIGLTVIFAAVYLVLVPLLVLFMLKDKPQLQGWFRRFLPRDISLINTVWADVDKQLANYIRGKFLEIVIVWSVAYIMFLLLGLNYPMLLALLVGFSVLVPYLGALVVTIPIAAVAWSQWGADSSTAWVLIGYGILQALDGNVLVPLLFSEAVDLHPVAIIVAVLFFGGIWGVWGVFFAIPLATVVHAIVNAWPRSEVEVLTV